MDPLFSVTIIERFEQPQERPSIQFEYQELCSELEPIYGKVIWSLPYKPFATEFKIRKAHEIAQQRGIVTFGYLVGIVKKLP